MSRSLTRVPLSEASDAIEPQEALARRYVAYFRVSTQQQGNSGLGLDGQRRSIQNFLLHSPGDLLAEFTEIESGSKCDRPKLQEALRLCRVYGAVLLIARLDRLSRNVVLISTLLATGAEFIAADCPKANNFTIHVLAAAAEYELRLISERQGGARCIEGPRRETRRLSQ
jgi:DNA invertase Pin-like site-specific DNA recombinase